MAEQPPTAPGDIDVMRPVRHITVHCESTCNWCAEEDDP